MRRVNGMTALVLKGTFQILSKLKVMETARGGVVGTLKLPGTGRLAPSCASCRRALATAGPVGQRGIARGEPLYGV